MIVASVTNQRKLKIRWVGNGLNVDGGVDIFLHKALVQQHGVLVVIAFPSHEANEDVAAQSDLALIGGGAISQHGGILAAVDALTHLNDGLLVNAGAVVGAKEYSFVISCKSAAQRSKIRSYGSSVNSLPISNDICSTPNVCLNR